jgi:phosphatidylserine/phosphatidylglycerophosphate/cardiolipin synthase-like enzyme
VCDDVSFVGSFNFSRSGERNAENVLEIRDAATADTLARYVEQVKERYPRATPPDERTDAAAGVVGASREAEAATPPLREGRRGSP